ncbi:hypothetical protein C4D60_Mb10t01120 [Musa balbisiana]|uniref:Uncharacterized protein n=1 Tax=Musa balbisiana TaxID=52838 RepID=A0A4V4H4H0_MUSBA|nr:hypothetical protein C4D60_Mb10t01120 [Musa balbisiana]
MRTASSKSLPCPKCSGETVSFSTATTTRRFPWRKAAAAAASSSVELLSLRRFPRRTVHAAASSPSANGDSARSRFDATIATLMSFGWSQPDSIAVFRRHPAIWNLSKKNLCDKMTFLMKEAGYENGILKIRTRALTPAVKLSPYLQRPRLRRFPWRKAAAAAASSSVELLSLRRFPRRTVHAAASSPSANGDSARLVRPITKSSLYILVEKDHLFWKCSFELFQSGWSDAQVMKLMQREPKFLRANVETVLKPGMRSLQDMGFSDTEIVQLVSSCPGLLCLRDIQPRINFWRSLLGSNERLTKASRRSRFDATFATLMSFGWSQPDSIAAFRRYPDVWNLSKKNLCDKMTFLMKEAGCELTYIIYRPVLLTYSLEKRLRPRYEVMNFLDQNKLLDKGLNLASVTKLSEEKFRNKFLFLLRKEKFIAQYDSYVVAVQGKPHIVAEN